jgi:hypothetical protein
MGIEIESGIYIYWHSSVLVKLVHDEYESELVERLYFGNMETSSYVTSSLSTDAALTHLRSLWIQGALSNLAYEQDSPRLSWMVAHWMEEESVDSSLFARPDEFEQFCRDNSLDP